MKAQICAVGRSKCLIPSSRNYKRVTDIKLTLPEHGNLLASGCYPEASVTRNIYFMS